MGPWEKYGGQPQSLPVIQGPPKQPAPQTPAQAQSDVLGVEAKKLEIKAKELEIEQKKAGTDAAKLGVEQGKAAGFYNRAIRADQLFTETGVGAPSLGREAAQAVLPGGLVNKFTDPLRQQAEAAQADFIAATLRYESGAAIPPEELEAQRRRYFPVAGDSPETIQLKAALRRNAIDALRTSSGGAAAEPLAAQPPATEPPPAIGEAEYSGTVGGNIAVDDGSDVINVADPALAGLNAQINQMMKSGAGAKDFLAMLKEKGVPPSEVMPSVMRAIQWRKKHPNFQGDYSVDVETKLQRQGGMERTMADLAFSPGGAAAVAAGNIITGNRLDNLVPGGEQANFGMAALREAYPGASFAGDVVGGASLFGAGRAALGAMGRAPATGAFAPAAVAGDAAMGAHIASGSDGTQMFSPEQAALGALAGGLGGVAGRGAINTTARALSPSGGALAPAYAEGVKPTMGQRMGGVVNRAEQAFTSIPLVGGVQRSARNRAIEDWQAGAFNQSLREIGTELPKGIKSGTAAHAFMQNQFNAAYNRARSGLTFRQDPEFVNDFRTIANEVAGLAPDAQKRFANIVAMGEAKLRARGGVLSGNDYKTLASTIEKRIRAIRKNPNGDYELADSLEELSLALDSAARRHSTPEAVAALDAADRGYVMAVLIEEAGRKAGGGDVGEFTGKQLEGAMRSNSGLRSRRLLRGDMPMQDYAAAGVRLGDTVADSGTGERIATMGGMGALAHFIDPAMLTPWLANTLANLPGGKHALNALISPNRKGLDPARQALLKRAYLGGLLSAPAAEGAVSP